MGSTVTFHLQLLSGTFKLAKGSAHLFIDSLLQCRINAVIEKVLHGQQSSLTVGKDLVMLLTAVAILTEEGPNLMTT